MASLSVSEPSRGRGGTILFSGFRRKIGTTGDEKERRQGKGLRALYRDERRTRISGVYRVYRGVSRGSRRDSDEWIAREI